MSVINNKERTPLTVHMKDQYERHLNKPIVLVLNRNRQAINVRTPQQAFVQMATDVVTALDIDGDNMVPMRWAQWIKLSVKGRKDLQRICAQARRYEINASPPRELGTVHHTCETACDCRAASHFHFSDFERGGP
jgi:hypothetical protein